MTSVAAGESFEGLTVLLQVDFLINMLMLIVVVMPIIMLQHCSTGSTGITTIII